jgi:hypothetical protein
MNRKPDASSQTINTPSSSPPWADDRFNLGVESAPHATVMTDKDGRIVLVNAQT